MFTFYNNPCIFSPRKGNLLLKDCGPEVSSFVFVAPRVGVSDENVENRFWFGQDVFQGLWNESAPDGLMNVRASTRRRKPRYCYCCSWRIGNKPRYWRRLLMLHLPLLHSLGGGDKHLFYIWVTIMVPGSLLNPLVFSLCKHRALLK